MGPRAQLVRPVHLAQKEQKERLQEQTALPGRLEQKEPRARLGPLARKGRRALATAQQVRSALRELPVLWGHLEQQELRERQVRQVHLAQQEQQVQTALRIRTRRRGRAAGGAACRGKPSGAVRGGHRWGRWRREA